MPSAAAASGAPDQVVAEHTEKHQHAEIVVVQKGAKAGRGFALPDQPLMVAKQDRAGSQRSPVDQAQARHLTHLPEQDQHQDL